MTGSVASRAVTEDAGNSVRSPGTGYGSDADTCGEGTELVRPRTRHQRFRHPDGFTVGTYQHTIGITQSARHRLVVWIDQLHRYRSHIKIFQRPQTTGSALSWSYQ